MVEEETSTSETQDEKSHDTSEVAEKKLSDSDEGCEDKPNNDTEKTEGEDKAGTVENENDADDGQGIETTSPYDELIKTSTNVKERAEKYLEQVLTKKHKQEQEERAAQKAKKSYTSGEVIKSRYLEPIYNDNGEIIGYNNPLHIGHLDIRVGEIQKIARHPKPSKNSRYTEVISINKRKKRPKHHYESKEELLKKKEEKNLVVESGIPLHYSAHDLWRQKVIILCNVKPFTSRGVDSKVVVLCAKKGDKIELLKPPDGAVTGDPIVARGYASNPHSPYVINISKHLGNDLRVNKDRQLVYKDTPLQIGISGGYITTKTFSDCNVSNVMGYDFV